MAALIEFPGAGSSSEAVLGDHEHECEHPHEKKTEAVAISCEAHEAENRQTLV